MGSASSSVIIMEIFNILLSDTGYLNKSLLPQRPLRFTNKSLECRHWEQRKHRYHLESVWMRIYSGRRIEWIMDTSPQQDPGDHIETNLQNPSYYNKNNLHHAKPHGEACNFHGIWSTFKG